MNRQISKILIANRGEIACRVIRSARKLGIETVAVYSEMDKNAKNVQMSDEAYCIGAAPSRESYLNQEKIITVAERSKCDAIHPGYGFLSENADFAEYCFRKGIIFIGPPASAIRDMGIKSTSKKIMSEAGVPIIPGYHEANQSDDFLKNEAIRIGFPLMIKAVYGGGGKGMRIVHKERDFFDQLESARRESMNSFGNDSVLLERFIPAPRHVEVQVFADHHGNCVHLNERDCSVQRRHQKVIEEAPAPRIDAGLRNDIGSAAVRAAKAVKYVGAGTVEFIYDEATKSFYFMEMNTRLQVEHPVTEMITDTDLVEWQIKIANGEKLPLNQDDIPLNGHSVEARIYAEDPYNEFLPGAGPLIFFSMPKENQYVRVETGVRQGDEVSVHYDPLIAKLIVWGANRREAFAKLKNKLQECQIVGLNTNVEFLTKLCSNEKLLNADISTAFIEENQKSLLSKPEPNGRVLAQVALALVLWEEQEQLRKIRDSVDKYDPFVTLRGFRINHLYARDLKFVDSNKNEFNLKITYNDSNSYTVLVGNDEQYNVSGSLNTENDDGISLITNFEDTVCKSAVFIDKRAETNVHIFDRNGFYSFEKWESKFELSSTEPGIRDAVAPMPGIVSKIFVEPGTKVNVGDPLMIITAMKMEHVIKAPKKGVIGKVLFGIDQRVTKNIPIVVYQES